MDITDISLINLISMHLGEITRLTNLRATKSAVVTLKACDRISARIELSKESGIFFIEFGALGTTDDQFDDTMLYCAKQYSAIRRSYLGSLQWSLEAKVTGFCTQHWIEKFTLATDKFDSDWAKCHEAP